MSDQQSPLNILIIGASYGALIGAKIGFAGHRVTVMARADERACLTAEGMHVRLPLRGDQGHHTLSFACADGPATTPKTWGLVAPQDIDPQVYHMAFLAISEPQAGDPAIVELFTRITKAGLPVVSLMNMAPLSFLGRIPQIPRNAVAHLYQSPAAWDALEGAAQSLASPDAQAYRPDPSDPSRLEVTLPTNLKVAPFADPSAQATLTRLAQDIAASRLPDGTALPVKLIASADVTTPFAKLPMLLTGNYRCVLPDGVRSIAAAVHDDIDASAAIYDACCTVLRKLQVPEQVIVPFEKYAAAAQSLTIPSSAARAIAAGATRVERSDALMLALAKHVGVPADEMAEVVALIDRKLAENA